MPTKIFTLGKLRPIAILLPKSGAKKYIAFTGIAYPEKFFNSLRNQCFVIDEEFNFPDHESLSDQEIERILTLAQKKEASVITTEKDFIKIPEKYRNHIQVLKLNLSLGNENIILQFLKNTNNGGKIQLVFCK